MKKTISIVVITVICHVVIYSFLVGTIISKYCAEVYTFNPPTKTLQCTIPIELE